MRPKIESSGLRLVATIAQEGSLNKAAEKLCTVQSNITSRLKTLEASLDVMLFERTSKGVALTNAGRKLLPFARKIETLLREAQQAVVDTGELRGELRFGSMETTAALRLPPVLASFTRRFPLVDLVLETGTTAELVDRVISGELDGALVSGPLRDDRLQSQEVFREQLVLVTKPAINPFASWEESPNLRIVVFRAGCSYRAKLERLLSARGISPLRILEFGTLEGIIACVSAGLGITVFLSFSRRIVLKPAYDLVLEAYQQK